MFRQNVLKVFRYGFTRFFSSYVAYRLPKLLRTEKLQYVQKYVIAEKAVRIHNDTEYG